MVKSNNFPHVISSSVTLDVDDVPDVYVVQFDGSLRQLVLQSLIFFSQVMQGATGLAVTTPLQVQQDGRIFRFDACCSSCPATSLVSVAVSG